HWVKMGRVLGTNAPKIFQVNWFRKGADGSFLWPGFGENSRVLEWIVGRIEGESRAGETPIGPLPAPGSLDVEGLDLTDDTVAHLFDVDTSSWLAECDLTEEYFAQFGDRVPAARKADPPNLRYHLQPQG